LEVQQLGNFVGVVLALLPLMSKIRKVSLAVWGYALWIATYNFVTFVNTVIWHNNVDIVAPVWCDIATKLQTGSGVGTPTCAFAICMHLNRITRLRGSSIQVLSKRRECNNNVVYELILVLGLPLLVMSLYVVVQPVRFAIQEELGCIAVDYSYAAYIVVYTVPLMATLGCAVFAPLTMLVFMRHRREMKMCLAGSRDISLNKYKRLMLIVLLDTFCNLPVFAVVVMTSIVQGSASPLDHPYISWKNVHDGAGGSMPGLSLNSIVQVPASEWSLDAWSVFLVKWGEWFYVLHAILFFSVFGTTPEMRQHYTSVFWFLPERIGYKRNRYPDSEVQTLSDISFDSNPGQFSRIWPTGDRRCGSLSFLETIIGTCTTVSTDMAEATDLLGVLRLVSPTQLATESKNVHGEQTKFAEGIDEREVLLSRGRTKVEAPYRLDEEEVEARESGDEIP